MVVFCLLRTTATFQLHGWISNTCLIRQLPKELKYESWAQTEGSELSTFGMTHFSTIPKTQIGSKVPSCIRRAAIFLQKSTARSCPSSHCCGSSPLYMQERCNHAAPLSCLLVHQQFRRPPLPPDRVESSNTITFFFVTHRSIRLC